MTQICPEQSVGMLVADYFVKLNVLYRTVLETIICLKIVHIGRNIPSLPKYYSTTKRHTKFWIKNKVLVYIFFQISSHQIKKLIVIFKSVRINFKNHAHKYVIF